MSSTRELTGDGAAPATTDGPAGPVLAHELVDSVTVDRVNRHLVALQQIADRNGGQRASGTSGHEESVDYIAAELSAAGYDVVTQEFPILYQETVQERLVVDGESVPITVMRHSPNSPDGGVSGPLAVLPADRTGCEATDFDDADYTGAIVLVRRGGGPLWLKQQHAAAAGAIGTVVYNNNDEWLLGNLASDDNARIPTGGISKVHGEALVAKHGAPATLELHTRTDPRTSRTVIAQTKTGRKDNVVMAGAHLDSVVDGPGINDAGTGCAALLETALQLGGSPEVANALRFAWWGAEELGQVGSNHYVQQLTAEQKLDIALYLNLDMLGSSNGAYFVFDGDNTRGGGTEGPEGSGPIGRAFTDYLAVRGVQTDGLSLVGGFDHARFMAVGIPVGGLYTGATGIKSAEQADKWGGLAGVAYDPCYHQPSDNLDNVDRTALANNTAAVAWVLGLYATSTDDAYGVPDRARRAELRPAQ